MPSAHSNPHSQKQAPSFEKEKSGSTASSSIPTGPRANRASSRGTRGTAWRGAAVSPFNPRFPTTNGIIPAKRDRLGDIKVPLGPKLVLQDHANLIKGKPQPPSMSERPLRSSEQRPYPAHVTAVSRTDDEMVKTEHTSSGASLTPVTVMNKMQDVIMEDAEAVQETQIAPTTDSKPGSPPPPRIADHDEHLEDQDFKDAINIINREIANLEKQQASIDAELIRRQQVACVLEDLLLSSRNAYDAAQPEEHVYHEMGNDPGEQVQALQSPPPPADAIMSDAGALDISPRFPATPQRPLRPPYTLEVKSIVRRRTPPVADLPFRRHDSSRRDDSELLKEQEDEFMTKQEAILDALRETQADQEDALEDYAEWYREAYKKWRLSVIRKEEEEKEQQRMDEIEQEALASAHPVTTPGRRRTTAFGTDLDIEMVLKQSAAEAEEDSANPDYEREALIPDMLTPMERQEQAVPDYKNIVRAEDVWSKFGFWVPSDKFTEEEHEILVQYLESNAPTVKGPETGRVKAFGLLAEQLQNKSYRDCIIHYYLSKKSFNWKQYSPLGREERDQAGKPKRGRGKPKPTSSSLVSNLAGKEEAAEDNGGGKGRARLQRKAAPQQFLTSAPMLPTPPPEKPTRARTTNTVKGQKGASATGTDGEKKQRKPRSTVPKDKQARKPRNQHTVPVNSMDGQLESFGPMPAPLVTTTWSPEEKRRRLEEAQLLASFAAPSVAQQVEIRSSDQRPLPGLPPSYQQASFAGDQTISRPSQERALTPKANLGSQSTKESPRAQGNSYWSKSEKNLFPELYRTFGSNWEAIAGCMEAKTPAMVSKYIQSHTLLSLSLADHPSRRLKIMRCGRLNGVLLI